MQIIISVMIVGLLWMIYDLINAPEVDENENVISDMEETEISDEDDKGYTEPEKHKSKVTELEE